MVRRVFQILSSLFEPFFIGDLDLLGYPSASTTFPLISYLLNVNCDYDVSSSARCLSHGQAWRLGSDFRYSGPLCLVQPYVLSNL